MFGPHGGGLDPSTYWRAQAQRGQPFRDSPDGGPGIPPQNQAAMAATAPSYTTNPYPTATGSSSQGPITIETAQQSGQWRTLAPSAGDGPPAPAGGINAPASQGGVSQPYGNQGTQVVAAYQKYLGRTPSAEEIGSHLGYGKAMGTQNVLHALDVIRNSEEARAFQSKAATPAAGAPGAAPAPFDPTGRQRVTSLMEGDPAKLANPDHIAKSPKYQFLSLAPYFGRGQEGELLKELQRLYGGHWNGWVWDGKGNFRYTGDPAALHADWKGETFVDAYGGYQAGGPLQARWGVGENRPAPAGGVLPGGGGGGLGMGGGPGLFSSVGLPTPTQVDSNTYSQLILQYLAQQLGLGQALSGGK